MIAVAVIVTEILTAAVIITALVAGAVVVVARSYADIVRSTGGPEAAATMLTGRDAGSRS